MEKKENRYIRFDWAMKRLLRNKANFDVFEGFLITLLGENIKINSLLENKNSVEYEDNKYNRIDFIAESSKGDHIIIEVQNNTEYVYFQRVLFETSKLLTEYINRGICDEKVRKIYCINIMYFDLMSGRDVVYYGKELDEWIFYLKYGEIADDASAPCLDKVRERMKVDLMPSAERNAYYRYIDNLVILKDNIYTARKEGYAEGTIEGDKAKAMEMARLLKQAGVDATFSNSATFKGK